MHLRGSEISFLLYRRREKEGGLRFYDFPRSGSLQKSLMLHGLPGLSFISVSSKGVWNRRYPRFARGAAAVILHLATPSGTLAPEFSSHPRQTTEKQTPCWVIPVSPRGRKESTPLHVQAYPALQLHLPLPYTVLWRLFKHKVRRNIE